jgi:hypothetical protein
MTHQLADTDIRRMPSMVLKAIRAGAFLVRDDVDVEKVRILCRIVGRAHDAGHDVMPIMVDYAAKVDGTMPRCDDAKPWTPEMREIHELVWPFVASSYAMMSTFWIDNGRPNDIEALTTVIQAWIAEREVEAATTPGDADRDIREEMDRVNALYPRLGMSYGYIGNIWHGPYRDDRSFRIFTQVQTLDAAHGATLGMGDHSYEQLSKLRTKVLGRLEDWARGLDQELTAGTKRLRSTAHLARIAA